MSDTPRLRKTTIILLLLAGCGGNSATPGAQDAAPDTAQGDGAVADGPSDQTAGNQDAQDARRDGASDAATDGTTNQTLPCAIETVLKAKCQTCHRSPPLFGAPFPLLTYADTQRDYGAMKVWQAMRFNVMRGFMPPQSSPTGPLTADEKTTLLAWLDGGTPPGTSCTTPAHDAGVTDGPADSVTTVGPAALPCTPTHQFRAHGATVNDPYPVPQADDTYRCFTFQVPFGANEQATAWAPIIDDARVLHHWILYAASGTKQPTGCSDPGRTFLMGWAPGGTNYLMPADIGLELPDPGRWLTLEVHYNNRSRAADAADRSGVAVCTTDTARPKVAGVITLGSTQITLLPDAPYTEVVADCPSLATALLPEPLHVMSSFPHMHERGVTFRTDIVRGGVSQTLVDIARWDFANQRSYPVNPDVTMIAPGDRLLTTCTYNNEKNNTTVKFGGATSDEMCFNFVLAYPISNVRFRECVNTR